MVEFEMQEDSRHDGWVGEKREDLHLTTAAQAEQRKHAPRRDHSRYERGARPPQRMRARLAGRLGTSSYDSAYRENGWVQAYNEALEIRELDEQAALGLFIKANLVYKDRPETYVSIASILAGRAEYEGAIDAYEAVLRTIDQPTTRDREEETLARWANFRTVALLNLGQLYLGTDRPEEAAAAFQAVLDADPDNEQAKGNLATGGADVAMAFRIEFSSDTSVGGYSYEVVN